MRFRTLLLIGGVVGSIGVAMAIALESLGEPDEPGGGGAGGAGLILAGLFILVSMAGFGFVAGWFGRERDDVVVIAIGVGIALAAVMAVVALTRPEAAIGGFVFVGVSAVVCSAIGTAAWWIGNLICDGRDLPTASRLTAPAYAEDDPGYPMWTTDAGPAIRRTLDELAVRLDVGAAVEARAVGIVVGLPRDIPVVVLLVGGRLAIQPIDINGVLNGELSVFAKQDIAGVSAPGIGPDGMKREAGHFWDVITIRTNDGSRISLRLPYGDRGVGPSTGGPDVILDWLMAARPGVDR
jgi:hypothetical protein